MRVLGDRVDRDGGTVYRLTAPALVIRPRRDVPEAPLAPIAVRDGAYRALSRQLGLADDHHEHLLTVRALPAEALSGFATWRGGPLVLAGGGNNLAPRLTGVPGTWRAPGDWWEVVDIPRGILVPVPDSAGRLQAFQHRADVPTPGEPKYRWLSSRGWPSGSSPGTPVAVWRPHLAQSGIWITEGSLKAAVAAHHLPGGTCVVGVAGVATWRSALPVLSGLIKRGGPITVAYDADARSKPEVALHQQRLTVELGAAGYQVLIATWDGDRAKGIDDALLAGISVTTTRWYRTLPPATRPFGLPMAQVLPSA